jgi:isopenicillin-N epimerase
MKGSELAAHWLLDESVVFLNHGSFGACPRAVLERQSELRHELEREPVDFFVRRLEGYMVEVREVLGAFIGAPPEDLAMCTNATTAVNAVLRSLPIERGAELLTTDHEYNACRNALDFAAERAGARVVVARLPFPIADPSQVVDAIESSITERTKLLLVDHVTSPTGLVLPIADIIAKLRPRGIMVLVDGAHAPGMIDLDLASLQPDFYAGNLHKWACTPKGAAFLYVRPEHQAWVRPTTVSHGANANVPGRSRFRLEFDWVGTIDPTAMLCVPRAIEVMGGLVEGGWPEVRRRNRALVLAGGRTIADALGIETMPAPPSMIGSLLTLPLPGAMRLAATHTQTDPLHDRLFHEHRIEVPIFSWRTLGGRFVRISAQLYNAPAQYEALAHALAVELPRDVGEQR